MWKLYVLLLTSFITVPYAELCTCSARHPQWQYCSSDFVILATIENVQQIGGVNMYTIKPVKQFRLTEEARVVLDQNVVYTRLESSLCGVTLQTGVDYLLTGYISNSEAHINLCGFNRPWNGLTKTQQLGFNQLYEDGCICEIHELLQGISIGEGANDVSSTSNSCQWYSECHFDEGICLKSASKCEWWPNNHLDGCLVNKGHNL